MNTSKPLRFTLPSNRLQAPSQLHVTKTASVERNPDFQQMTLPLVELGRGERVIKHTRLEAQSARGAWYELFLIKVPNGFHIEKISGAPGCGRHNKETWFRRHLQEAERKFDRILTDKTNPARRSPRKYAVVGSLGAQSG